MSRLRTWSAVACIASLLAACSGDLSPLSGPIKAVGLPRSLQAGTSETGLIGPKGDKGDVGPAGPNGPKGDQGEIGPNGAKGDKGDKGDLGERGPVGVGAVGPQGAMALSRTTAAYTLGSVETVIAIEDASAFLVRGTVLFSDGVNRFHALVTAKSDRSLTMLPLGYPGDAGAGAVFPVGTLVAVSGQQGPTGNTGPVGPQGPQGVQGIQGIQGLAPLATAAGGFAFANSGVSQTVTFDNTAQFALNSVLLVSQGASSTYVRITAKDDALKTLTLAPIATVANTYPASYAAGAVVAVAGALGAIGPSPITTIASGAYSFGATPALVTVNDNRAFALNSTVIVTQAGNFFYATVSNIPAGGTELQLTRIAGTGNADASVTFNVGTVIAVSGPVGPTGATGATGAQGAQGDKGDKGDQGNQGLSPLATASGSFSFANSGVSQTVTFDNTAQFALNSVLLVSQGASSTYVRITAKDDALKTLTLAPIATVANTYPASYTAGAVVAVAGPQGPIGAIPITTSSSNFSAAAGNQVLVVGDSRAFGVGAKLLIVDASSRRAHVRLAAKDDTLSTMTVQFEQANGDASSGAFTQPLTITASGESGADGNSNAKFMSFSAVSNTTRNIVNANGTNNFTSPTSFTTTSACRGIFISGTVVLSTKTSLGAGANCSANVRVSLTSGGVIFDQTVRGWAQPDWGPAIPITLFVPFTGVGTHQVTVSLVQNIGASAADADGAVSVDPMRANLLLTEYYTSASYRVLNRHK